ncbi:MAG: Hsp20/alpha crystallin family protein [Gammaproteobacteria bacterium]|nr:MAG: Hsp20/alpha crystallin family protein [Gammaproteobacteria bacterium]
MAVVRYDPWSLLGQVQQDLNRVFEGRLPEEAAGDNTRVVTSSWVPAVDIREEPDRFVIRADLPGIDPKDIEITMEEGVLTIKGERSIEEETQEGQYHRIERARGTFYRRFSLPDTADPERIEAHGKNGVLEIVIPKLEKVQPRKIEVRAEE